MTPIKNLKTLTGGIGHAKLVSRHMKFGWLILISSFPFKLGLENEVEVRSVIGKTLSLMLKLPKTSYI